MVLLEQSTVLSILLARRQLIVVVGELLQFIVFLFESLLLVEYLNLSESTELLSLLPQQIEEHEVLTFTVSFLRVIGAA